MGEQSPSW